LSSKLYNVKRKIASILESDENLRSILGGGPIIVGWPLGEHIRLPSITITDVYLRREISGLGGLSNNLGQFEIYHIILQVDVWADSEGIRDRISEAIWSAVLKALDSLRVDGIIVGSPSASTDLLEDWRQLAHFHYRSHHLSSPRKIFSMRRGDEVCGVIVYSYPPPACFGRRLVLPKMSLRELNERLSTISRVVIHPKYRSIGLGAKLVRNTLPICGTPYVETVAVMARYNPFFEKAGMVRVAERSGDPTIRKASEELEAMGFERYMQTSLEANIERLNTLSREEVDRVKEIILEVSQVYYRRLIGGEKIYAVKEDRGGGSA